MNPLTPSESEEKFARPLHSRENRPATLSPTSSLQRHCMAKIRIKNPSKQDGSRGEAVYEIALVGAQHVSSSKQFAVFEPRPTEQQPTTASQNSIVRSARLRKPPRYPELTRNLNCRPLTA